MKFSSGILCDDIRKEDSGKFLIIGAYGTDIVVPEFPSALVLSCLLVGEAHESGDREIKFQILLDGTVMIKGHGLLSVGIPGNILLPIQNLFLNNIRAGGDLSFEIENEKGEWEALVRVPVKCNKM